MQRKSEDCAIREGPGSQEHVRHDMMREAYEAYEGAMERAPERSGGPLTRASRPGNVWKVLGPRDYAGSAVNEPTDRGA